MSLPIEENILMYSIVFSLTNNLAINVCQKSKNLLTYHNTSYNNLQSPEKIYYSKYAMKILEKITGYMENVSYFEFNDDFESEIQHNFKITWGPDVEKIITPVSLYGETINIVNILPEKIMQYCKQDSESEICIEFEKNYEKLMSNLRNKIIKREESEKLHISKKTELISNSVYKLIIDTLKQMQHCALHLYNHIFSENNRIVFNIAKNKFRMYDFENPELNDVTSFKIGMDPEKKCIILEFNNEVAFLLTLKMRDSQIKERISLELVTKMVNIDKKFMVQSATIV